MTTPRRMNYWEYIRVEDLLRLQTGFEAEDRDVSNDETLFIVVHQIYELWFKIVLRELTAARNLFRKNPVPDIEMATAVRTFRRVVTIFEQAIAHWKVIETLTSRDYLEFRDRLIPASGFQSAQLREIEIVLGLDDSVRLPLGREGSYKEALRAQDGTASPALQRVEARIADAPSLKHVLYDWLSRTPIDGSNDQASVDAFLRRYIEAHRAETRLRIERAEHDALTRDDIERLHARYDTEMAQAERFLMAAEDDDVPEAERARRRRIRAAILFIESYRELPRLAWPREVIESVVEMEQAFIVWRQRHARMVERIIGRRVGTGGSAGVDYLDQTALRYRVFGDLWAVRTLLLRKPSVPSIEHSDEYRFRVED